MNTTPDVKWEEREDPAWLNDFFAGQPLRVEVDGVIRYTGKCPHCQHTMTIDVPIPVDDSIGAFADAERLADSTVTAPKGDGDDKEPAPASAEDGRHRCNCVEGKASHAGRPSGAPERGCGRFGYAQFDS